MLKNLSLTSNEDACAERIGPCYHFVFSRGGDVKTDLSLTLRLTCYDQDPEQPGQRARAASKAGAPEQAYVYIVGTGMCVYSRRRRARI